MASQAQQSPDSHYRRLIEIGIALSAERNHDRLLEMILDEAMAISNADGGTLYLRTRDDELAFTILRTDSLNLVMGGTSGNPVSYPTLALRDAKGEANHRNVATHVALTGQTSNIPDVRDDKDFDFSGTRAFDDRTGYRSTSFLTVPLKNTQDAVIGVLQLINARKGQGEQRQVVAFSEETLPFIEALASQAAMSIENQQLLQAQKDLLAAFMVVIADAIDEKSAYTGGHCKRVPILAEMLAAAATEVTDGPFAEFDMSEDEKYEFHIAAWMHDCGKITTPVHVVDKGRKLETIHDRIDSVRARISVIATALDAKRNAELAERPEEAELIEAGHADELSKLHDAWEFIQRVNVGGEFLSDEDVARIEGLGDLKWTAVDGSEEPLLSEEERESLSVRRGTLTDAERQIINNHVSMTIKMLEQLPFPENLKRVPEIAGAHHETLDGTGYPNGLTKAELTVQARILGIADVFEALTAADRPYKVAKSFDETLTIMARMRDEQHIDGELFELFLRSGTHLEYGRKFLTPEQVGDVDIEAYLN